MSNVYRQNGYSDREHYLSCLAEDYGLDLEQVVRPLANLLGPSEDFDGLVSSLEDMGMCSPSKLREATLKVELRFLMKDIE